MQETFSKNFQNRQHMRNTKNHCDQSKIKFKTSMILQKIGHKYSSRDNQLSLTLTLTTETINTAVAAGKATCWLFSLEILTMPWPTLVTTFIGYCHRATRVRRTCAFANFDSGTTENFTLLRFNKICGQSVATIISIVDTCSAACLLTVAARS